MTQSFLAQSQQMKLVYDLFLQSLKAQEAALSDSEDKDDMDITDSGKS